MQHKMCIMPSIYLFGCQFVIKSSTFMHVFNKFARLHVFLSTAKRFRYISLGLQNV